MPIIIRTHSRKVTGRGERKKEKKRKRQMKRRGQGNKEEEEEEKAIENSKKDKRIKQWRVEKNGIWKKDKNCRERRKLWFSALTSNLWEYSSTYFKRNLLRLLLLLLVLLIECERNISILRDIYELEYLIMFMIELFNKMQLNNVWWRLKKKTVTITRIKDEHQEELNEMTIREDW